MVWLYKNHSITIILDKSLSKFNHSSDNIEPVSLASSVSVLIKLYIALSL